MQDINDYSRIPDHMMSALRRYIDNKIKPGDFLTAVLTNDLRGAVGRADHININIIPVYVSYLYNEAPGNCWGSTERVKEYLEIGDS